MFELFSFHRSVGTLLTYSPLAAAISVFPPQLAIRDGVLDSGTLRFTAHATMGDFAGATTRVTGAMIGGRDFAGARGFVEASVASLTTGNDRRDRDLRSSMETNRYPTMRFDLESATLDEAAEATDSLSFILHGVLSIHGVARRVDLMSKVLHRGDTTHLTAEFPLDLREYRIGGLTKLLGLLRMEPQIEVMVSLRFIDRAALEHVLTSCVNDGERARRRPA